MPTPTFEDLNPSHVQKTQRSEDVHYGPWSSLNGDLRIFAANFIHFPLVLARQWASSSLNGKLTGMLFRVSRPGVSALGLNTRVKKRVTMSPVLKDVLTDSICVFSQSDLNV